MFRHYLTVWVYPDELKAHFDSTLLNVIVSVLKYVKTFAN